VLLDEQRRLPDPLLPGFLEAPTSPPTSWGDVCTVTQMRNNPEQYYGTERRLFHIQLGQAAPGIVADLDRGVCSPEVGLEQRCELPLLGG
jgi:hypothetical protein